MVAIFWGIVKKDDGAWAKAVDDASSHLFRIASFDAIESAGVPTDDCQAELACCLGDWWANLSGWGAIQRGGDVGLFAYDVDGALEVADDSTS